MLKVIKLPVGYKL
jgi:hypothetical protein